MAHLTAPKTERTISEVEVVSDDSMQVLLIGRADNVVKIRLRDATESNWASKVIATLDKRDAEVIATIFETGYISTYGSVQSTVDGLPSGTHSIEKPVAEKGPLDGDCTPLDIARAEAENLREAKEIVLLEMERDHALDKHITAYVNGCPACDRATYPGHGDGSLKADVPAEYPENLPF